ncbi:MAG: phosphoenolpyruvate--protein phosphotransferase, partial [Bacteroidetes bacterium]|nr:phosphoenolpyruvate--protein phosphotransferase [Bacteroidota bacterium]
MVGIGVSPGISIGRASVVRPFLADASGKVLVGEDAVRAEVERYKEAVRLSVEEVEGMLASVTDVERDILEVQLELIQDEQMEEDVLGQIVSGRMMARDAVLIVTEAAVKVFEKMEDEYMRERGADVRDAGNRIINKLIGGGRGVKVLLEDTIVIAEELSPSDTIGMDREKVIGFATQIGGKTSHAAIVARLRGLPAVVGVGAGLGGIVDGDLVIVDGSEGVVLVNPPAAVLEDYRRRSELFAEEAQRLLSLKDAPAITKDGVKIELQANIATAEDMERAVELGAEGVGLLRTELLFMARESFPTEEEQFLWYKAILEKAGGRPVTIRTLDIGGDKPLLYLGLP